MSGSNVYRGDAMKKVTTLLAVMAMLVLPAAASAQSTLGYGTPAGQVQTTINNGSKPKASNNSAPAATTPAPSNEGNLPFTGLEVAVVAAAGLALVATGVGLRKAGNARS
jgi:hypothetical protein